MICQVNSLNERDLDLLNRRGYFLAVAFLEGLLAKPAEVRGNNRSVMPFDVLGGTRNTLMHTTSLLT